MALYAPRTAVCALCQHGRRCLLCHITNFTPLRGKINREPGFYGGQHWSNSLQTGFLWVCLLIILIKLNISVLVFLNSSDMNIFGKTAISQNLQTAELEQCSQHEIMLPTSSLSCPTCDLERLGFQCCSIKAADQRVNLSGSRAWKTQDWFLQGFFFLFCSLFHVNKQKSMNWTFSKRHFGILGW